MIIIVRERKVSREVSGRGNHGESKATKERKRREKQRNGGGGGGGGGGRDTEAAIDR